MVKEYLEKTRDQFVEELEQLREEDVNLSNHLKENIKLIQMLEETNDPNYASFTPRDVDENNKIKISQLQADQSETDKKLEQVKFAISEMQCKIDEINSVIKVASEESGSGSDSDRISILETQEKERQRIARDLHDSTVQNLTSLVHKTELCMKLMDVDPIRCRLELSSLNKILRTIIEDTRKMIYDLRPMSFDDMGFDITVERYLDKLKASTTTVKYHYLVEGEPYSIKSVIKLTLLRVIQEACSNAVKHAEAENINVVLKYQKNNLQLEISDDGKGVDLSILPDTTRDDNSGFGLSMMKERIYLLSGSLDFNSKPGEGFHIIVNIPINEEEK